MSANSNTSRIYLDYNATAPILGHVKEAVSAALNVTGNPTAQHADGRNANSIVSKAREAVGLAMGVCAQDIIFNSGGTEGDNTAIYSAIRAGCKHLLISSMDHPATINAAENFGVSYELIPTNSLGQTDLDWLADRIRNWDAAYGRPFVSITAANSETGVIQDIEKTVDIVHDAGGLILVDAVQALGKLPMVYIADYISVSAHKLGGPKGVGALYVSPDAPFSSLLSGGGQERRRRSGTHNVAGIAGFGAACEGLSKRAHIKPLRDDMEAALKAIEAELTIFGEGADRLPNTSFFAVPDASSMTLMMALDLAGVSVSTGTACSSGKVGESRAIKTMGMSEKAPKGAIRVSLGSATTRSEIEQFLQIWGKIRRKDVKFKGAA